MTLLAAGKVRGWWSRQRQAARWWLGFDIGGRRTKAGVVSDAGEVRRARMDETAHQPFDVVWRGLLAYAREAVDAGVLGAVARVMQAVGANDASSASPA